MTSPDHPFWMEASEELRLIQAARRGKTSAYAELVRWHHATLFRLTYALTRSEPSAVSLAREAVARGQKGIGHIPDEQRFLPWLTRIARNLAVAHNRRAAGDASAAAASPPAAVTSGRIDATTAERFERALADVDVDDQLILALCLVERLAYSDIEKVLMLPQGSVLARISNARVRIEEGLGPAEAAA